jgi:small subunit ribosomal protein S16
VLKIRLRRTGAKKQPRYRVVVADSRAPRDGAFVEVLGWYNPQADPAQVVINTEKADAWLKQGAQPSDRVAYLLKQAGVGAPAEPVAEAEPEPVASGRQRSARASRAVAASQEPEAASEAAASEKVPGEADESEASSS